MGIIDIIREKTPRYPASLNIALIAVFTPLTTALTMFIQVPVPATEGYINIGEVGVFLSGLLLGPVGGAIAGGVGSALADWVTGWVIYVPWTFVIKGMEGLIVGLFSRRRTAFNAVVVIAAGLWMVAGYFLVEGFLLWGVAAAAIEIPGNLVQVGVGATIALLVATLVRPAMPFPKEGPQEKEEPTTKS
ncbi:MAG: ECF transporter S component [Promethearchaeota archaeon]